MAVRLSALRGGRRFIPQKSHIAASGTHLNTNNNNNNNNNRNNNNNNNNTSNGYRSCQDYLN
jgi:hypothetical protein